jgi:hypothetical protein
MKTLHLSQRTEDLVTTKFWKILQVHELFDGAAADQRGGYRRRH